MVKFLYNMGGTDMRKLKKAMLVQAILMGTLLLFVGRLMYSFQISSLILILVPIVLLIR